MTENRYAQLDPTWGPLDVGPIHFVGVGGAGMSVLAQMFRSLGAVVSGSDSKASDVTRALSESGIAVNIPQDGAFVSQARTVVLSSAIRNDNPEFVAARDAGLTVIHRSQALALLMRGRRAIAVAGAHGKTTTSAMIAVAAQHAGLDPSFAIGGSVRTKTGAIAGGRVGSSDVLVAEADESDGSFLNYEPHVAVVTNIEPDHLDHYGSKEAFEQAFEQFVGQVPEVGFTVVCADDEGAFQLGLVARAQGKRVLFYGTSPVSDVAISQVTQTEGSSGISYRLKWQPTGDDFSSYGEFEGIVELQVPGFHNALNSAGAFASLVALGARPEQVVEGLEAFIGTGRRFELRGTRGDVRVIDDYAHHPTEVAALLNAARVSAGAGRVVVLFQPHLFSRTRIFASEFAQALDLADQVVLTGIYAAREDNDPLVTSDLIAQRMTTSVSVVDDRFEAAREVARLARPDDLVLTVGAGDVTELGQVILDHLAD